MAWTLSKLTAKPNPQSENEPLADYLRNIIQTANDPILQQFAVVGVVSPGKEVTPYSQQVGLSCGSAGQHGRFLWDGLFLRT